MLDPYQPPDVSALPLREAWEAMRLWFAIKHFWAPKEQNCPGCTHHETNHDAGACYACGYCGWSILGDGNGYGMPAGWCKTGDAYWKRDWYNPGDAWWEQ